MTTTINASNSGSGGLIQTADASGVLALQTAGTTAVTVDASQNVGIGTSSPAYDLDVRGTMAVLDGSANIGFWANGTSYTQVWQTLQSVNDFIIQTAASKYMSFGTNSTERMRIDTSGNLLSANGVIQFTSAQYRSNVASSQLQFINNSAGVSLAVNGTSWGSLSDERDKEIIEPITDAASKVASLRSVIGRYKVDDVDKRRAFLIAQDVKAVLPEAVTELEDEQQTLILQYTEVIPLLVAAIKEQQALITSLTARIAALEGTPA